jgi:hypothetical protein
VESSAALDWLNFVLQDTRLDLNTASDRDLLNYQHTPLVNGCFKLFLKTFSQPSPDVLLERSAADYARVSRRSAGSILSSASMTVLTCCTRLTGTSAWKKATPLVLQGALHYHSTLMGG